MSARGAGGFMASDNDPEILPPSKDTKADFITPAEIPGRMLRLLARNVVLVEALQAKVAFGLKAGAFDDGYSAAQALGVLVRSNESCTKLHQLFEPRAEGARELSKTDNKSARASAEKLMGLLAEEPKAKDGAKPLRN